MSILQKFFNIVAGTLCFTLPMWAYIAFYKNSGNQSISILNVLLGSTLAVAILYEENKKN